MRKREESTVNSFTDLEEAIRGLAEEELAEHSHVTLSTGTLRRGEPYLTRR